MILSMRKNIKYVIFIIFVFVSIYLIIQYIQTKNLNNAAKKVAKEEKIPDTTNWKIYENKEFGFSFERQENINIDERKNSINVDDLYISVDHLRCINPKPKYGNLPTKLYGYDALINEKDNFAYICNNTNTACLDIKSQNTKQTTEGFFHAFISTIKFTEQFDKIACN